MSLGLAMSDEAGGAGERLADFVTPGPDGMREICFAVPDAYCAACIQSIEAGLTGLPGVTGARVNLTRRRVTIRHDAALDLDAVGPAIARCGYRNFVVDPAELDGRDPMMAELVRALAVSGFAAGNIMLFSVSIWAGADAATREMFHWLSALLALPAIAYAGRPFFRSALSALRARRSNMDVPIAIGLLATTALSLYETATGGSEAYFDASTMLLFFLLVGRTLDHMMRVRARSAVENLSRLQPRGANCLQPDGTTHFVRLDAIEPGMILLLRAGDRVPVDAALLSGSAEIDLALVTGEAEPVPLDAGQMLPAGAAIIGRNIRVEALRPAHQSFLSRIDEMMQAAEQVRTRYRRLADRVSQLYAPVVHLTAALTFAGWMLAGASLHQSLLNAVSVLIITCPCALALAVPIVHVVAAGRLFSRGILLRDGAALERLARVRVVGLDKTGTLTEGRPRLVGQEGDMPGVLDMAARLAAASNHPLSRALVEAVADTVSVPDDVDEVPGAGLMARVDGNNWRLGSAAFCDAVEDATTGSKVWLSRDGETIASFRFADTLRPDARDAVAALGRQELACLILSGDRHPAVVQLAAEAGIEHFAAGLTPEGKVAEIGRMRANIGPVLMIGDGINDAPAMRAADVSMAPGSAADIGRAAADLIMTRNRLSDVPFSIALARKAETLVRQNLVFAVLYNLVVLPLAIAGHVSPLIAALAMSSSSIVVVANAMRLRFARLGD